MSGKAIVETTQFLTFTLEKEVFAVDIARVREVLEFTSVTKVPRTPDFMSGVINLRGSVVPVVDLRIKFGMQAAGKTVDTCIIIIEIENAGEKTVLGALADSVKEVMSLEPEHIENAPKLGTNLRTEFIRGMGKEGNTFIIILDTDRVFSAEELSSMHDGSDESSSAA
ncbi:CheW protein [Magnetococcus marinus MC-1]|uniref:CheW protein n=1 Tax=Magnetococcus marinus (strain ATCC BAA-1437 / JCM 17883 / MC-1) TaxID=156889 RepID=A0LDU5_MAGMM|nr:chemotaxis protein CheW [Magnetococcus marinus]ABK46138.1 CheW protein [Magnetococcus marinus MC-1]